METKSPGYFRDLEFGICYLPARMTWSDGESLLLSHQHHLTISFVEILVSVVTFCFVFI